MSQTERGYRKPPQNTPCYIGNIGSVGVSNPIAPDPQALSIACILYLNWCCFVGSKIDSWRLSQAVRCISVVNGLIGRGISLIDRSIALTPLSGGINLSDPPQNKLGKPSNNSLIHLFVLSVLFTNLWITVSFCFFLRVDLLVAIERCGSSRFSD